MYTALVFIEIVVAIFLIIVILMQNSKGGGLSQSFGGGNIGSVFGVRRASDFLSNATSYLAGTFIILSLLINLFFLPGKGKTSESVIQSGQTSAPAPQIPVQSQPAQQGQ